MTGITLGGNSGEWEVICNVLKLNTFDGELDCMLGSMPDGIVYGILDSLLLCITLRLCIGIILGDTFGM